MKRRAPRSLSNATDSLIKQFSPETAIAEIQVHWLAVVGQKVAAQTAPISEIGGVLRVECKQSVWANELELMSPQILKKLNEKLQRAEITKIRFSTGSSHSR